MMHESRRWLAPPYRYLQGLDHELRPHVGVYRPPDDPARMGVQDEGQVERKPSRVGTLCPPARPCVGPTGHEVPAEQGFVAGPSLPLAYRLVELPVGARDLLLQPPHVGADALGHRLGAMMRRFFAATSMPESWRLRVRMACKGRASSPGMTLGLGPTAPAKRARIWASIRSVLASLPVAFIAICCQKGNSPTVISNMG